MAADKMDNTITVVAQPPKLCRTSGKRMPVTMPAKIAKILPMLFRDTRSFWSSVIVVTMPKIGTSQSV